MTTLTTTPLAPLMDRLFAEAGATWTETPSATEYWSRLSDGEQERLIRSKTDYLTRVRSSAQGYMSVPFNGDVELSMRLG